MKYPIAVVSLLTCGLAFGTLYAGSHKSCGSSNLTTKSAPANKPAGTKGLVPEDDPGKLAKDAKPMPSKPQNMTDDVSKSVRSSQ